MKHFAATAKKSYLAIATVALFCLFLTACRSQKQATVQPEDNTSASADTLVNHYRTMDNEKLSPTLSMAEMTIGMWKLLDDGHTNVWFSPLSLALAMRTVADGAKGETQEQLRRVITDLDIQSSNQISIADALFIDPSVPLQANYVARCKARGAEMYQQTISAKRINQWASDHTNNKINQILDDPRPASIKMVIANAVYFYAQWADPFNERGTREDTFYLSSRAKEGEPYVMAPLMRKSDHFSYARTDDAQILTLPYEEDDKGHLFGMTIVLPREGLSASDLLAHLTAEQLNHWFDKQYYERVILRVPKIKMSYNRSLTDDLRAMGVTLPFTPAADFSGMSNMPLCIDMVKQSAFLDMNERGTEAAAVTVAAMKLGAAPHQEPPVNMTVNRPYLLMLHDRKNHIPVFVGIIHTPKQ